MEDEPLVTVSEAFLKGMERKVEGLKKLMEMSAIFSSTFDPDDLISLIMALGLRQPRHRLPAHLQGGNL
jgi:hypothetical protein